MVLRQHGHFFATSHRKPPCDGIGGTIIRLTARKSLQRAYQDQILTAEDVTRFCQEKVLGWNNYNLYLYSSGSAGKRLNERKIPTGQKNPRKHEAITILRLSKTTRLP